MPICPAELCQVLRKFKPTVERSQLRRLEAFQKKGQEGVKKFENSDPEGNKFEFIEGLNDDIESGKFDKMQKSKVFGIKIFKH